MNEKHTITKPSQLETPFETIALAFSGGGFRAGTFALGVLSYLEQTTLKENESRTLLDNVNYLSSTSGGTITTAMYSLYSAEGKSFAAFYKALFEHTDGTSLVSEALRILNDRNEWVDRPNKRRNLINSFALAYDKLLFQGASVEILKTNQESGNSNLEEVCFNATELYNGLLFRQTVEMKKDHWQTGVLYGNFNLSLKHETARNLLLSDLLAASSCFPVGFEPIVFPQDFENAGINSQELLNGLNINLQELDWDELLLLYSKKEIDDVVNSLPKPLDLVKLKTTLQQLKKKESVQISLMDGGITDNQGVESMIQANERKMNETGKAFDLMMVCDVASHFMEAYQLPKEDKTSFWSINRIRIWSLIVAILGITSLCLMWKHTPSTITWYIVQCVIAIVSAVTGVLFFLSEKIKNTITGQVRGNSGFDLRKTFPTKILALLFKHFGNLRLNFLKNMLLTRITTLITLSNDVFLKRIRYLLYNQFFQLNDLKSTGRAKANHIYDLSFSNDLKRKELYCAEYIPSYSMQKVAENAFGMSTTLWFSEDNDKEFRKASIIACGQFNTCFNLLDYIWKLKQPFGKPSPIFDSFSEENKQMVNKLQQRLEIDFKKFYDDPFWMYNQLGKSYQIAHFKEVNAQNVPDPKEFKGLR
ncbi:Patatin-like phospholipase [compost metagenome]